MYNIATVKSEEDLINLIKNIDNLEYLESHHNDLTDTSVKLKLCGKNFESSLPGSLIIGLAKYQEKIYRIYLVNKYGADNRRKITSEEAKLLEIKVVVNKGSTEIWIQLINNILEVVKIMPSDQIQPTLFGLAGIIMAGACLLGVGSMAVKEAFKAKRKELSLKKVQAKNEIEKEKYEFIESVVNSAIEGMRAVSLGIVQADPSRVLVNDNVVSTAAIRSVANELEPGKLEAIEDRSVITGTYRIQRLTFDFKKNTASADILDVETGDSIHGIIIQPKGVSDGSYQVLKTAEDQRDVKLQIMVTKRNGRIYKAVLDRILE
jgi:hypothetical protein